MKEEHAVLDFFSKIENLPLALSVAEQTDLIRERINSDFWSDLSLHLMGFIQRHDLAWQIATTEDRNTPDSLVGFHCALESDQALYIRPMMEQQNLGKGMQIYFGLMWSDKPTPEHLSLPAVTALRETLTNAGYKGNESFLAWQWTKLYPRSKSFLLSYTQQPEQLFAEIEAVLTRLLLIHRDQIALANAALAAAPRSMTVSLDQLRIKRKS
jgi:hypothetical protein